MKVVKVKKEIVLTKEKSLAIPHGFKDNVEYSSCVDAFGVRDCSGIGCSGCMLAPDNREFLIAALMQQAEEE